LQYFGGSSVSDNRSLAVNKPSVNTKKTSAKEGGCMGSTTVLINVVLGRPVVAGLVHLYNFILMLQLKNLQ